MQYARTIGRFLCGNLYRFCVLILPPLVAFAVVFGTSDTIKQTARNSGVYESITAAVLDQSATSQDNNSASHELLSDPAFKLAAAKAFPPNSIQTASEAFIDGTYSWLMGKSDKPAFRIDLSEQKKSLIQSASEYIATRLSSLPACNTAQVQELRANMPDVLSLQCLPPGVDPKTVAAEFTDNTIRKNEFLTNPVITVDTLPKDPSGKTIYQQLSGMPVVFQWLSKGVVLCAMLLALSALGYVLLSSNRRKAIRHCAAVLVVTGGLLLVSVLIYGYLMSKGNNLLGGSVANVAFRDALNAFLLQIAKQVNTTVGYSAGIYVGIGAIGLAAIRLVRETVNDTNEASTTPSATPANPGVSEQLQYDNHKEDQV